ncbi:MAG TPA: DUF6526 family protein [Gemmatimonadales bacterium]|jgi:hypothetical protein
MDQTQSYEHHVRYVPAYHFVLSAIVLFYFVFALIRLIQHATIDTGFQFALAVGLWIIYWYMRVFAIRVQDRVIRLEERLRLEHVLPPDLRGRIGELSPRQLVALRFAHDDEVTPLARRALDEKLSSRDIKRAIKTWRPDHLRA